MPLPSSSIAKPQSISPAGMSLLMCIGCVLVVNSHMEAFYPRPWMAGDGLLGNLFFFLLSGYRIAFSQRKSSNSFIPFYWRRILRIYPSVWMAEFMFGPSVLNLGNWEAWLRRFVWPTRFTYIEYIGPFYALLYPILRYLKSEYIRILLFIQLSAYALLVICWSPHPKMFSNVPFPLHHLLYFSMVVVGSLASRRVNPWSKIAATLAIPCFLLYLVVKFIVFTTGQYQYFWLVHALGFAIPPLSLALVGRSSDFLNSIHMVWPNHLFSFIANRTLEIYVIHSFIVDWHSISSMRLPFNIFFLWVITLVLASAVLPIAQFIQHKLSVRKH